MAEKQPRPGALAICSQGRLGLILSDGPTPVHYADGNSDMAWLGIHVAEYIAEDGTAITLGMPWSSRHPHVIGYLSEVQEAVLGVMKIGHPVPQKK